MVNEECAELVSIMSRKGFRLDDDDYPKLLPRGSSLNSELYVLPAYRKDTGRIPEGYRKAPSHSLSVTRNPLVISS